MIKSIILIGNKDDVNKFLNGLQPYQIKGQRSRYQVDGQNICVTYLPDTAKAVHARCSGFIVVNANGMIPDSVIAYLPRLPSNQLKCYPSDSVPPMRFLQDFASILQPVESLKSKLKLMLFGGKNKKPKPLRLEIGFKK